MAAALHNEVVRIINKAILALVDAPAPYVFSIIFGTWNTRVSSRIDCNKKLQYRLTMNFSPPARKSSEAYCANFGVPSSGSQPRVKNRSSECACLCLTTRRRSRFPFFPCLYQGFPDVVLFVFFFGGSVAADSHEASSSSDARSLSDSRGGDACRLRFPFTMALLTSCEQSNLQSCLEFAVY